MRAAWGLLGLAIVGWGCNTKKKAGGFAAVPQQVPMAVEVYDAREDFPPCVTLLHGTAYTARDTGARYECNAQQQDWVLLEGSGRMTVRQVDEETVNRARTAADAAEEHKNTADEAAVKAELKKKESALQAAESALSAATSVEARKKAEEEVVLAKEEVEKARKKVEETKTSEEKAKDHLDAAVLEKDAAVRAKDAAVLEKNEAVKAKDDAKVEKIAAAAAKDEAEKQKKDVAFLAKNHGVAEEITVPKGGNIDFDASAYAEFKKAVDLIDSSGASVQAKALVYDPRMAPGGGPLPGGLTPMLASKFKAEFFATQNLGLSDGSTPRLLAVGAHYYLLYQKDGKTFVGKYDSFFREEAKKPVGTNFAPGQVQWALSADGKTIHILGMEWGALANHPLPVIWPAMKHFHIETDIAFAINRGEVLDLSKVKKDPGKLRAWASLINDTDLSGLQPKLMDMAVSPTGLQVMGLVEIGAKGLVFLSPTATRDDIKDTHFSYTNEPIKNAKTPYLHITENGGNLIATAYYIDSPDRGGPEQQILKKAFVTFERAGKKTHFQTLDNFGAGARVTHVMRLRGTKDLANEFYLSAVTDAGMLYTGFLSDTNPGFKWITQQVDKKGFSPVTVGAYANMHVGTPFAGHDGGVFFQPESNALLFWDRAKWGGADFRVTSIPNMDTKHPHAEDPYIQLAQSPHVNLGFSTMVWGNGSGTEIYLRRIPLTKELMNAEVTVEHPGGHGLTWRVHNPYPFPLHVQLQLNPKQ